MLAGGWVVRKESGGALETPGHLVPSQFHPRTSLPIPETVTLFFFYEFKELYLQGARNENLGHGFPQLKLHWRNMFLHIEEKF